MGISSNSGIITNNKRTEQGHSIKRHSSHLLIILYYPHSNEMWLEYRWVRRWLVVGLCELNWILLCFMLVEDVDDVGPSRWLKAIVTAQLSVFRIFVYRFVPPATPLKRSSRSFFNPFLRQKGYECDRRVCLSVMT